MGLLDAGFFPAYFEELDLLMRMRAAGWKIWYEPRACLIHHESQSLGAGSTRFIRTYTLNRLRYIALNGTTHGKCAALKAEWAWLRDWRGKPGFWAIMQAYWRAGKRWRRWRSERETRPMVGQLSPQPPLARDALNS